MAVKREYSKKTLSSAPTTSSFTESKIASSKEVPVEFSLSELKAKKVSVAGTFNNWDVNTLKLKKSVSGGWNVSVNLKPGRYEYRFFVDGEWMNDPKLKETVVNPFGTSNSILRVEGC